MNKKQSIYLFILPLLIAWENSFSQTSAYVKTDKKLAATYARIAPFYYGNPDSLLYYSDLFSTRLRNFVRRNPSTIGYNFPLLTSKKACRIVTTTDGTFRIYSWNTWLGGTMGHFRNLFQFKSDTVIYTTDFDYGQGDMGTYFTGVYSLTTSEQSLFLALSWGTESTRYQYETACIYAVTGKTLKDKVKAIRTSGGRLTNAVQIEYDISAIPSGHKGPGGLIRYDTATKILSVPVMLKRGKLSNKKTRYRFNGRYFEKLVPQKMHSNK